MKPIEDIVLLKKEIQYIKNYISLQNLRLKDSSGVRFSGNLDHYIRVITFKLFIENAFKYGTDYTGKTDINIQILIEENNLTLNISDYISVKEKVKTTLA